MTFVPARVTLQESARQEYDQATTAERDRLQAAQLHEQSLVSVIGMLIEFLQGHTSKTEVVNQLQSVSTPDVERVVQAVSNLAEKVEASKIDLTPLKDVLEAHRGAESAEQSEADQSAEERHKKLVAQVQAVKEAVSSLKLDPVINVDTKAPQVSVEKTDLKPLEQLMRDVVSAVKAQKPVSIPEFPMPEPLGERLDDMNENLKKLIDKPHPTPARDMPPYYNFYGERVPAQLDADGHLLVSIGATQPVSSSDTAQAKKITVDGSITYIAVASPGTDQADALWQVQKIDESVAGTTVITWADGDGLYDNIATDLTALAYA